MRRAAHFVWRLFLGMNRGLVAWVPSLLILVLGALYMYSCLQVLAAPGTGLSLRYTGQGGVVLLTTDTYSFDIASMSGRATGVRLTDPEGNAVARASSATVRLRGGSILVDLGEGSLTVERRVDGSLSILDLVRPPDPQAKPQTMSVRINELTLRYVDRHGGSVVTQTGVLSDIDLSLADGKTLFGADLAIPMAGRARIGGTVADKGGYDVTFKTERMDVVPLKGVVGKFVDWDDLGEYGAWSASGVVVSGSGRIAFSGKGEPWTEGRLKVEATGLNVGKSVRGGRLTGVVAVVGTSGTFVGSLVEAGRSVSTDSAVDWSGDVAARGSFRVTSKTLSGVWPEISRLLPKELEARGLEYVGTYGLVGGEFSVGGRLGASWAKYQSEEFSGLSTRLAVGGSSLMVGFEKATWREVPVSGWLSIGFERGDLGGYFQTVSAGSHRWDFSSGDDRFIVTGDGRAVVKGTTAAPSVTLAFDGRGLYERSGRDSVDLGTAEVRVGWSGNKAVIERAVARGEAGVVTATGSIDTLAGTVDVDVESGGIDLGVWTQQVSGVAYVSGKVSGPMDGIRFVGDAKAYNVSREGFVLPSVTSRVAFDGKSVSVAGLSARMGVGEVSGSGNWDVQSGQISGSFTAEEMDFSDFNLGETLVGRFGLERLVVSGTMDDPVAVFAASSEDLTVGAYPVDLAQVAGGYRSGVLSVDALAAKVGEGSLKGSGRYVFESGTGQASVEIVDVPFERAPVDRATVELLGSVSGTVDVEFLGEGKLAGAGDLAVYGLAANSFEAGSGPLKVEIRDGEARVSGQIGSTSGILEIPEAGYRFDDGSYHAQFLASGVRVSGVVTAALKGIDTDDERTRRLLESLDGQAHGEFVVSGVAGSGKEPGSVSLRAESLKVDSLTSDGRLLGSGGVAGSYSEDSWKVDNLTWTFTEEGDRGLRLSGSGVPGGAVNVSGEVVRFDPAILSALWPDLTVAGGEVNSTFVVGGTEGDLTGRASVNVRELAVRDEKGVVTKVPVVADTQLIELEDGVVTAEGDFFVRGLPGRFSATVPLAAFDEPPTERAWVEALLTDRSLADLKEFVSFLDLERSEGKISAAVRYEFDREGGAAKGNISLEGGKFVFNDVETELSEVSLEAKLDGSKAVLSGFASSSLGGLVSLEVESDFASLLSGRSSELEEIPLLGFVAFDDWRIREKIKLPKAESGGKQSYVVASKHSTATWSGKVTLAGSVGRPKIGGEVEGNGVFVSLPAEIPPMSGSYEGPVMPEFDGLQVRMGTGSSLTVPTGDLVLKGSAVIEGPLDGIEVRAPLSLEAGSVNLPASRIKLDEGGKVTVTAGIGDAPPRVDVDLTGTTVVTVKQAGDRFQTYRLHLEIRGDLLDAAGVNITGTSDPPDLSAEQIRAIVGQQDFIESMVSSIFGGFNQAALSQGLFTLAIPSLTQGFTAEIAKALSLDYMLLDYNAFDGAVVRIGKTLGAGLVFRASRQLSSPAFGGTKYDIGVSYSPSSKAGIFGKLTLTLEQNEQVPWRLGLGYSLKF